MIKITAKNFEGVRVTDPDKTKVVHAFDVDDCLNLKPSDFQNVGLTKDEFFDKARDFTCDERIAFLTRLLHEKGDAIAICTARPLDRLQETIDWLETHNIPYDLLMLSRGHVDSCMAKQEMLHYLQHHYRMVGTFVDDSPWNCRGAELQGVSTIHVLKNCEYWEANPEEVTALENYYAIA